MSENKPSTQDCAPGMPEQTEVGNYFVSNYPPYSQWQPQQVPAFEAALENEAASGPLGLYVHIPFCRQRCSYCYFRVHPRRPDAEVETYIDALLAEGGLFQKKPAVRGRAVSNVYFGGGTPTLLSAAQLRRLIGGLRARTDWSGASEVTCECQPGTVNREKLEALREFDVTRASIGMQSLSEDVLRRVGRAAGRADCVDTFQMVREAGFEQVNIDLLAGLPGETEDSWMRTIEGLIELSPDCVTVYQLELTHNSPMYGAIKSGADTPLPTWPVKRRWVGAAFDRLEQAGYTIYGAYWAVRDPRKQRFAYVSEHYWRGHELLSLGETAFGLLQGCHYQNTDNYESYVARCREGRLPASRAYKISHEEMWRRELILLLKTGRVDTARLDAKYHVETQAALGAELRALRDEGYLTLQPGGIQLTRAGLLNIDWLLPRLYLPQHKGVRYT
jgi:oxygen-independent coproporphyrinogen-3 oxidase